MVIKIDMGIEAIACRWIEGHIFPATRAAIRAALVQMPPEIRERLPDRWTLRVNFARNPSGKTDAELAEEEAQGLAAQGLIEMAKREGVELRPGTPEALADAVRILTARLPDGEKLPPEVVEGLIAGGIDPETVGLNACGKKVS